MEINLGKAGITTGGIYDNTVTYSRLTVVTAPNHCGYMTAVDGVHGVIPGVTEGWEKYWVRIGGAGVGIRSIYLSGSEGYVDTYTIEIEDGSKSTFQVTNGHSSDPVCETVTLEADGWEGYAQMIRVEGITSSNNVLVSPTPDSLNEYARCGVRATGQADGVISFSCQRVPEDDLDVNVSILVGTQEGFVTQDQLTTALIGKMDADELDPVSVPFTVNRENMRTATIKAFKSGKIVVITITGSVSSCDSGDWTEMGTVDQESALPSNTAYGSAFAKGVSSSYSSGSVRLRIGYTGSLQFLADYGSAATTTISGQIVYIIG